VLIITGGSLSILISFSVTNDLFPFIPYVYAFILCVPFCLIILSSSLASVSNFSASISYIVFLKLSSAACVCIVTVLSSLYHPFLVSPSTDIVGAAGLFGPFISNSSNTI
jgi:hypothetical protein